MRVMLSFRMPIDQRNADIKDGSLPSIVQCTRIMAPGNHSPKEDVPLTRWV